MTLTAGQLSAFLVNDSASPTSIAIWIDMPVDKPGGAPIAWFSALLQPRTFTQFVWETTYAFIWADTGPLASGATVSAEQHLFATPGEFAARLESVNGNSYQLVSYKPTPPLPAGALRIETAGSLPENQLTIGVNLKIDQGNGLPGNGCAVVQAQPNLAWTWTATETYYAGFGAITQSEYDFKLATETPLKLDFSIQSTIGILLGSDNVLRQMSGAEMEGLITSGDYTQLTTP